MMTSRELVYATLEGQNTSGRIPRQIWTLPVLVRFQPSQPPREPA